MCDLVNMIVAACERHGLAVGEGDVTCNSSTGEYLIDGMPWQEWLAGMTGE